MAFERNQRYFFRPYKILKISRLNDNVTEYNNAFNLMNIQFVTVHFLDSVIFKNLISQNIPGE